MNKRYLLTSALLLVALLLSSCQGLSGIKSDGALRASGTISAREVQVAPELGGMVAEVAVEEGAQVQEGDVLFRLNDTLIQAQRRQAEAAVQLAQAAVNTVKAQYELTLNAARLQEQQGRAAAWGAPQPDEFGLPVWYYTKEEKMAAAQAEVAAAGQALETEKANLEKLLGEMASQEFLDAEKRLAEAQVAFPIAGQVLEQAKAAPNNQKLVDFAQQQYDAAKSELDAAQAAYDRLLTGKAAGDILEARARVAVAQRRYDSALDYSNSLLSGDQSLQVKVAEAGVQQAEAALAQAEAALNALDIQLEKTVVRAPISGVVLNRNLEAGETVTPGSIVIVIGQLAEVELVVYIPETEYGQVHLGDQASITVDSFPGETFSGAVVHISDTAEFTPRNVQTVEGRRATVYAIKLIVPNPELKLKPGMPADVTFVTGQ